MVDVPTNRLQKRNGTWYFRAKVPADLIEAYGQREEKRSLRTSNEREARTTASILSVQFDAKLAKLRRMQPASGDNRSRLSDLDTFEINRMVTDWMTTRQQEVLGAPIPKDISDDIREAEIDLGSLYRNDINARASILDRATHILADNKVRVEKRKMSVKRAQHTPQPFAIPEEELDSEQFHILNKAVRRALIHIIGAEIADAKGETVHTDFQSIFGVVAEGNAPLRHGSVGTSELRVNLPGSCCSLTTMSRGISSAFRRVENSAGGVGFDGDVHCVFSSGGKGISQSSTLYRVHNPPILGRGHSIKHPARINL